MLHLQENQIKLKPKKLIMSPLNCLDHDSKKVFWKKKLPEIIKIDYNSNIRELYAHFQLYIYIHNPCIYMF